MTEAITQKELARRLGDISDRQVRNLTAKGLPRNEDGSYPWPEAHTWYIEFKKAEDERRRPKPPEDSLYDRARARKVAAEAELAETELAQLRGQLVSIDDVEALVRKPLEQVDAALRNAPSRHAAELAQLANIKIPVAMKYIEQLIEAIRADLRASATSDDAAAAAA